MAAATEGSQETAMPGTPVVALGGSNTARAGYTVAATAAAASGVARRYPQKRSYYSIHDVAQVHADAAATAEPRPIKRHCQAQRCASGLGPRKLSVQSPSTASKGRVHEPLPQTEAALKGSRRPGLQCRQPPHQLCIDLCSSDDEISDVTDLLVVDSADRPAASVAAVPSLLGMCAADFPGVGYAVRGSNYGAARHVAAQLQGAAAVAANSRSKAMVMKLVVDTRERMRNKTPSDLISSICQTVDRQLQHGLPDNVTVDVDSHALPLGDYMWLLQEGASNSSCSQGTASATAGATQGCSACVVAGAVVERKTIRDIITRSTEGDHLRQLQRMYHFQDQLPHQLLIIENPAWQAKICSDAANHNRQPQQSNTTMSDTRTLFEFILRAAVSPYGTTQKTLLAPGVQDTRSILQAVTQLLMHGVHSRHGWQPHQQHTSAGSMTYGELSSCVNRWNRHSNEALPLELTRPRVASGTPLQSVIDTAFQMTHGVQDFDDLTLYSHTGSIHMHVVSVTGQKLLILLNSFYEQVTAAFNIDPSASLSSIEAVEVASDIGAQLASLLDAFIGQAGTTAADSRSGTRGQGHNIMLVGNLFGAAGNGAVDTMLKDQQRAAEGVKPADQKAAQRQAEMAKLNGVVVKQHLWLWLVCFVLKQQWHLMLCQSGKAKGADTFLEVAGSWCIDKMISKESSRQ